MGLPACNPPRRTAGGRGDGSTAIATYASVKRPRATGTQAPIPADCSVRKINISTISTIQCKSLAGTRSATAGVR